MAGQSLPTATVISARTAIGHREIIAQHSALDIAETDAERRRDESIRQCNMPAPLRERENHDRHDAARRGQPKPQRRPFSCPDHRQDRGGRGREAHVQGSMRGRTGSPRMSAAHQLNLIQPSLHWVSSPYFVTAIIVLLSMAICIRSRVALTSS
jgi:hypothetical protein